MRQSQTLSGSSTSTFVRTLVRRFFCRAVQRRAVGCAVALNLLLWPGPGLLTERLFVATSEVLTTRVGSRSYEAFFLRRLFSRSTTTPRHETMADRASAVARIHINPIKFVGYENERTTFTALPTDFLDRTVQGVKFSWESSDTNKLEIDDAGRARFLQPGLARVTCRAGTVSATAPVLIRPNHRPVQTDAEWRADQASLGVDGNIIGTTSGSGGVSSMLSSLFDKLVPTAHAQYEFPQTDVIYDELWTDPANLIGHPRNRVAESTALGSVMPEGSNFNLAIPLIGVGGRGLATNLTLFYNSRLWSRRSNKVTFDALTSWPTPGFSLGFGRMVRSPVYNQYNVLQGWKYIFVEPDGTRRYLGQDNGPLKTTDGSQITYGVYYSDGSGSLYYPNGTQLTIQNVNNRLLPTSIIDRNGNYIQIAYKTDSNELIYPPASIDYITDTLGRQFRFQYDSTARVTSITAPGFGGTTQNPVTQTIAQFDYQSLVLSYSFSGLTAENGFGSNYWLKHVYFPASGTGYKFTYSDYGMIYNYSARRGMSGVSFNQEGDESAAVSFNYPTSGSTVLTGAPAFTQRTEIGTNSPTAVRTYSTSVDTGAQTMTFTITQQDSTTAQLTRSTNASSAANGLLTQSEVKNGSMSLSKALLTYVNDGAARRKCNR